MQINTKIKIIERSLELELIRFLQRMKTKNNARSNLECLSNSHKKYTFDASILDTTIT